MFFEELLCICAYVNVTGLTLHVIDRGPIGMLQYHLGTMSEGQLTPVQLTKQYIKCRQLTEAANLLNSMNWNSEGESCHICLSLIVNHLLKMPLSVQREGEALKRTGITR